MPVVSHPALTLAKVQPTLTSAEIRRAIAPALPPPLPLRECKSNGSSSRSTQASSVGLIDDGPLKTAVCIRKLTKTASASASAIDSTDPGQVVVSRTATHPHDEKDTFATPIAVSEQVQLPSLIPVTRVSDVALARLRISRQGIAQTPTIPEHRTTTPSRSRRSTVKTAPSPPPLHPTEPSQEADRPHTVQFKDPDHVNNQAPLSTAVPPAVSLAEAAAVAVPIDPSTSVESETHAPHSEPSVPLLPETVAQGTSTRAVAGLVSDSQPQSIPAKPKRVLSRPSSSSAANLIADSPSSQPHARESRPLTASSRASLASAMRKQGKPPVMYSVLTGQGWQKLALHQPPPTPTIDTVVQATSTRVLKEMIDPGPPGPSLPAMVPLPISKANRNKLEHKLSYPSTPRPTVSTGTNGTYQYYSRETTPATAILGESLFGAAPVDPLRPSTQRSEHFHHQVPTAPPPTLPSHWSTPLPPTQRPTEPPWYPYPMPPPANAAVPPPAKRMQRVCDLRSKQQAMIISQLAHTSPHANSAITGKVKLVKFMGLPLVSG